MRFNIILLSLLGSLVAFASGFTVDNSTVALWDYSSGNGSVDLSANKLNGNLTNVQTIDNAAYFNGSTGFAKYPSMDPFLGKSALTLETEIKISSISSWITTVLGYAAWDRETYGYELRLRQYGDSVCIELCVGSAVYDGWDIVTAPYAMKLNTWYKIAAQFDGSTLAIFINDELVVTKAHTALLNFNNSSFTVGRRAPGTPDFSFNGYVKQVKVSSVARYSDCVPVLVLPENDTFVPSIERMKWRYGCRATNFEIALSTLPDFSQNTFSARASGTDVAINELSCFRNLPKLVHLFWKVKAGGIVNAGWSNVGSFYIVESGTDAEMLKMALVDGGVAVTPNPFNLATSIAVYRKERGRLQVTIHDIRGNLITTLCDANMPSAGLLTFKWNAGNSAGGVYFLRVLNGGKLSAKKILLRK